MNQQHCVNCAVPTGMSNPPSYTCWNVCPCHHTEQDKIVDTKMSRTEFKEYNPEQEGWCSCSSYGPTPHPAHYKDEQEGWVEDIRQLAIVYASMSYLVSEESHDPKKETAALDELINGVRSLLEKQREEVLKEALNARVDQITVTLDAKNYKAGRAAAYKEIAEKVEDMKIPAPYPNASNGYRKEVGFDEKIVNSTIDDVLSLLTSNNHD